MRSPSQTSGFASLGLLVYNAIMPAILIIFTLLSALRRGTPPAQLWRVFHALKQPLSPKTSFWLALCRQANFINHHDHPTALVQAWLGWSVDAQMVHLFEAWEKAPRNRKERMLRWRLRLRLEQARELRPSDTKHLPGLDALGVTSQGSLTLFGKALLGLSEFPSPVPHQNWWLDGFTLHIPHEPNWVLLWQLEALLAPSGLYAYSLDRLAVRQAAQRAEPGKLLQILENGLGEPVPPEIRAHILGQPVMQTSHGLLLEFSDPAELRQLRQSRPLRQHFEHILSPRHVLVNDELAPHLLKLLERRGIYARPVQKDDNASPPDQARPTRTHFSRAGLLEPLGTSAPILEFVQQAILQQMPFDMLYTAPSTNLSPAGFDAHRPETHCITPLQIENRGGHTYIIAYSHTRRGQRTYRLDRMEIPGTSTS